MEQLSKLAETMVGSEIVRLGNEISERKRRGEEIFNFTIGDFDPEVFPIPKALEELVIESYKHHYTNYPPAEGVIELRTAVSDFLKEWEGLSYATNEILIACGGRPLIYALFKSVVDEGDKVIYAAPSWNNNHYTNLHKGQHCVIETTPENNFMPTAADITPHVAGASLICLCTPQNPTGTTLSKETLQEICELVIAENQNRNNGEKKLYLMFDQMYWTLTYGNIEHFDPVTLNQKMRDYTIFVDGISKAFAATGVRVGWAMGPQAVIQKMKAFLSHIGAWAPMAEQKATAKYLPQTELVREHFREFKQALETRLQKIYDGLVCLKNKGFTVDAITPQAAIYLTVKFDLKGKKADGKVLESQEDVTEYLLNEAQLAVVPFYAFGASHQSPWYRLSVGTCRIEDIEPFLQRLQSALEKLQ
ncbi:MAG TPA: aminotransferase class I/II-fold pyridoxal phosphate-dependent enzyme [Parafilimonas sp.]|nr:aminotransferase class I/II-fold pyridoxal phosphate-dependent enzyme [Parafilimonas sp.]